MSDLLKFILVEHTQPEEVTIIHIDETLQEATKMSSKPEAVFVFEITFASVSYFH